MAKLLAQQVGKTPVLALLGSLHTLKKVDWTIPQGDPSVAELLSNQGFKVNSLPQHWQPETCPSGGKRYFRLMKKDDPKALTILNSSLMSLMKAKPHTSTKEVIDGFIVWECEKLKHGNEPHTPES